MPEIRRYEMLSVLITLSDKNAVVKLFKNLQQTVSCLPQESSEIPTGHPSSSFVMMASKERGIL